MKNTLALIFLVLVALVAITLVRTLRIKPLPQDTAAVTPMALDENALAQRLAEGLRIKTISYADASQFDYGAFEQFLALLEASYPLTFEHLHPERINEHSLLLTWTGSDLSLKPVLLAAHMDVVPVEEGTEDKWTEPPFSGAIADGFIWGRGALDDKSSLMGLLESVEHLLAQGYAPQRTIYLAFGHDEEVGGANGAAQIAAALKERGVRVAYTLDEGSAVTEGVIAGVEKPVAAIMAGEKGYISFRLTLHGKGGHSSTPERDSVIPRMARAVARLNEHPMPAHLIPPVATMLDRLAPEMPFGQRLAIANRWLLKPVLLGALGQGSITNALIRTTQAITVFRSGVKDNVIPSDAEAIVNYRLLPGDTIEGVRQHIIDIVDDDAIKVKPTEEFGNEAPPLSDTDTPAFDLLEHTVNEVFPQAVVSSGIILATTDTRHYAEVRDQSYYFAPFVYTPEDAHRIHGTNERIAVGDYANMVRFYTRLLHNTGTWGGRPKPSAG